MTLLTINGRIGRILETIPDDMVLFNDVVREYYVLECCVAYSLRCVCFPNVRLTVTFVASLYPRLSADLDIVPDWSIFLP